MLRLHLDRIRLELRDVSEKNRPLLELKGVYWRDSLLTDRVLDLYRLVALLRTFLAQRLQVGPVYRLFGELKGKVHTEPERKNTALLLFHSKESWLVGKYRATYLEMVLSRVLSLLDYRQIFELKEEELPQTAPRLWDNDYS